MAEIYVGQERAVEADNITMYRCTVCLEKIIKKKRIKCGWRHSKMLLHALSVFTMSAQIISKVVGNEDKTAHCLLRSIKF